MKTIGNALFYLLKLVFKEAKRYSENERKQLYQEYYGDNWLEVYNSRSSYYQDFKQKILKSTTTTTRKMVATHHSKYTTPTS